MFHLPLRLLRHGILLVAILALLSLTTGSRAGGPWGAPAALAQQESSIDPGAAWPNTPWN